MKLTRTIAEYKKHEDTLVSEIQFMHFPVERIRTLWDTGTDDQMMATYKIEEHQMTEIQTYLDKSEIRNWDFQNCEYFIETSEDEK
ncbi:DUF7683 domain-containing protein [Pelagicoccus albus]|uniref:DUF7683 domain-containing protein n=1 Tax=Pelagicoccus albus TaxID=415222 RepID=A0A7X1B3G5_9BACT|nr:hypothetical protein [Pelagicoccus albus]MBC2604817.1 hypothetical protein [Pelagicoccus albus]